MKQFFTLTLLVAAISVYAQPFATGKRSLTFTDNQRSDRSIPVDIYYPAAAAGTDVAVVSSTAKFPVVVFAHGFLINSSSYKWLADSLVKNGYIVVLPNTEDGLLPSHLDFGLDLNFLASRISSLNDSATSFLYQRVVKRVALGGHSMGGGATFLAAALQNSVVKAVFSFAAAETIPSATTAAAIDFKPTLIIGGSGDCVAKDSVQNAMYEGIFLACKTYVNFTDYWHCQFANNNIVCVTGQLAAGCGLFPPVNTSAVLSKTFSLVSPFLDYYLQDQCGRGDEFIATYNDLTGVTAKRRSCFFLPSCGPLAVKLGSFTGRVDNNRNTLEWTTAVEENGGHFELERSADGTRFSMMAKIDMKAAPANGASYTHTDAFPLTGYSFYRLRIVARDGNAAYSDIVKLESRGKAFAVTQLYPNPVKNTLTVQLQSDKQQLMSYTLTDITGRQVLIRQSKIGAGITNSSISLIGLSRGTYVLRFSDQQGIAAGIFKILKD